MSRTEVLGGIATITLGRDFRGKVPVDQNGEILVIQPKEVFSESIEEAVSVKANKVGVIDDRLLRPGDILCSIRHKFVSTVVKEEWLKKKPVIANSGLFIIRLNKEGYLPEFVSAFINCFFERKEFQDMLERQEQEKMQNGKKPSVRLLTKDCLVCVPIPYKSIEEQRKIAEEIREAQARFREITAYVNNERKRIEDYYKQAIQDYSLGMDVAYSRIAE